MKLFLDALQASNRSGTGSYIQNLLVHLPECNRLTMQTALVRPGLGSPPGWAVETLPETPRIASVAKRHARFGAYVDRLRPDVVHFPANFGTLLPIRSNHRAAIVTTLHDLTFIRNPSWFPAFRAILYRRLALQAARQTDLIITDSQSSSSDIQAFLGWPEDRICVVSLGVGDTFVPAAAQERSVIRAKFGLPATFFLYVGTIEPRKNLVRLIHAWDSIADSCGADLVIAGREGWKSGPYRKALNAARHADRIHRVGYVVPEDLPGLLSAATAFTWPSLYEGFGLPPLEAMACGTPVLTSNNSSMPEVAGDAALAVDPENETALAHGLLRILRDERLRDTLTRRGLERARRFRWQDAARKTVDAYAQALERRR